MTTNVSCACGAAFVAQPHLAGQVVACPSCKQPLQIPTATSGSVHHPPPLSPTPQPVVPAAPDPLAAAAPLQSPLSDVPFRKSSRKSGDHTRLLIYGGLAMGGLLALSILGYAAVTAVQTIANLDSNQETPDATTTTADGGEAKSLDTNTIDGANHDIATATHRTENNDVSIEPVAVRRRVLDSLPPLAGIDFAAEPERAKLVYDWGNYEELAYAFDFNARGSYASKNVRGVSILRQGSSVESRKSSLTTPKIVKQGTGFVVHPEGLIATCHHVVADANKITIHLGGKQYVADIVDANAEDDVALVKINARSLPHLVIAESQRLRLAQKVIVAGYPLPTELGTDVKVNMGTVSSKPQGAGKRTLQFDATINEGNSGGPLLNERRQVVGIVSSGVASSLLSGKERSEVGFALTTDKLIKLLRQHKIPFDDSNDEVTGGNVVDAVVPSIAYIEVEAGGKPVELLASHQYRVDQQLKVGAFRTTQEDQRIVVDSSGRMLTCRATLSLPFLTGKIAEVGIVPLDRDGKDEWTVSDEFRLGVDMLLRGREQPSIFRSRPPPVGGDMRAYFEKRREEMKLRATLSRVPVKRTTTYKIRERIGDEVVIHWSSKMSVADDDHVVRFSGSMEGDVYFDERQGVVTHGNHRGNVNLSTPVGSASTPFSMTFKLVEPAEADYTPLSQASAPVPTSPSPTRSIGPSAGSPTTYAGYSDIIRQFDVRLRNLLA